MQVYLSLVLYEVQMELLTEFLLPMYKKQFKCSVFGLGGLFIFNTSFNDFSCEFEYLLLVFCSVIRQIIYLSKI